MYMFLTKSDPEPDPSDAIIFKSKDINIFGQTGAKELYLDDKDQEKIYKKY